MAIGPRRNAALIKLQQSIDELDPPLMLDGRSYHSTYDYWTSGCMVVKNFVDRSLIDAAKTNSMKERFESNSKILVINNSKGSRNRSEGVGERLQIITKTQDGEDCKALRYFSRAQKKLLSDCRDLVIGHAKTLLNTNEEIDLVETILLGSLVPPSLTGGRAAPHRGPSLGLSPQRPANRAVTSLRLLPGLRPPAPRVQRHVRCPSELCLPTPFPPHPSPSRGTVRSPVALTASPAPDRGPHQPLAAHSRSEGRQPGALAGPIRWAPTNPQHPTLPRSTTLEAPPSHRHGPNSSRGPSLLCPGADLPAMRGAVQLGSVRLPITRRHHIGVTSQVSPPPVLLAARPSPGGQQYLDLL